MKKEKKNYKQTVDLLVNLIENKNDGLVEKILILLKEENNPNFSLILEQTVIKLSKYKSEGV